MLFDCLIASYGEAFVHYLSPDASIVNNPEFEAATVKHLQKGAPLDEADKAHLSRFELKNQQQGQREDEEGSSDVANVAQQTEVERGGGTTVRLGGGGAVIDALKNHRKHQLENQFYLDMRKLPVTSNIVEQFFSQVKLTLTYLRNSMLPSKLEMIMLLKLNAASMTKMTVQAALTTTKTTSTTPNTSTIQATTM